MSEVDGLDRPLDLDPLLDAELAGFWSREAQERKDARETEPQSVLHEFTPPWRCLSFYHHT